MQNKIKLGAASLTLAAFMAGCTPMAGTQPQASSNIPAAGGYNTSANTYTAAANTPNYNTATTNYDYNAGSNSGASYYDYGAGGSTTTTTSSGYDNYYAGGNTSSSTGSSTYYDYNAPSSGSSYDPYAGGTSSGSVSGSHAVQVVASPNRSTAEAMLSQMQSMGFTATIDQVGGYYKVRVPYASESEAKSNLSRIRATVPDAFYTTR